jgi:hypothetical protein
MYRGQAGRGEIGNHVAQQLEVDLSVGRQVQFSTLHKMYRPLPGDVSSLAHHMRWFDVDPLVCIGKAHRILIVQLGILNFDRNICQRTVERPEPRIA